MAKLFNPKPIIAPNVRYNPMFVNYKCKLAKMGASKLIKFLISNWSKGLEISCHENFILFIISLFICFHSGQ